MSRRQPINRGRHLSRQFFEEGERQQETDWENSPLAAADAARDSSIDFKSFDEVPSRRGPLVAIAVAAVTAVVGLVGWTIFGVASSSSAPVDQSAAALLQIQAPQAPETTLPSAPQAARPSSATVLPAATEAPAAATSATVSAVAVPVAHMAGSASPPPVLEVPVVAARSPKAPVSHSPIRGLAPAMAARAQPARKTASVKPAASFKKAQPLTRTKAQPARALKPAVARPAAPSSSAPGALLPVAGDGAGELSPPASEAPSLSAPTVTGGASEAPAPEAAAVPSEATAAAAERPPALPPVEIVPPSSTARPQPPATPDLLEPAPAE
ncbi:MAG: hypothetical protein ABJA82_05645 [Myxococcales bacterium]